MLGTVTITGPDLYKDAEVVDLAVQYPFVEFGILFAESRQGKEPRYQPLDLFAVNQDLPVRYSAHLCGKWCRDFITGGTLFFEALKKHNIKPDVFKRVQFNISTYITTVDTELLAKSLLRHEWCPRYIVQVGKDVPDWCTMNDPDLAFDCLHDCSGGRGIEQTRWPAIYGDKYGYAGGLTPHNLLTALEKMKQAANKHKFWIDVESGVRTNDVFDFEKADEFLRLSAKWKNSQ
jgi:hypothetical protein